MPKKLVSEKKDKDFVVHGSIQVYSKVTSIVPAPGAQEAERKWVLAEGKGFPVVDRETKIEEVEASMPRELPKECKGMTGKGLSACIRNVEGEQ